MSVGAPPTTSAGESAAIRRSRSTTSESNSGIRGHLVPKCRRIRTIAGLFRPPALSPELPPNYARRGEEAGNAGASQTRLVALRTRSHSAEDARSSGGTSRYWSANRAMSRNAGRRDDTAEDLALRLVDRHEHDEPRRARGHDADERRDVLRVRIAAVLGSGLPPFPSCPRRDSRARRPPHPCPRTRRRPGASRSARARSPATARGAAWAA